jgi:hypothetical protein
MYWRFRLLVVAYPISFKLQSFCGCQKCGHRADQVQSLRNRRTRGYEDEMASRRVAARTSNICLAMVAR